MDKNNITTADQMDMLVSFMEEHGDITVMSNALPCLPSDKRKLWKDLTQNLNCLATNSKNEAQWRKVWADRKFYAKKKLAKLKSEPTSGSLTELDYRLLKIMGYKIKKLEKSTSVPMPIKEEYVISDAEREIITSPNLSECESTPANDKVIKIEIDAESETIEFESELEAPDLQPDSHPVPETTSARPHILQRMSARKKPRIEPVRNRNRTIFNENRRRAMSSDENNRLLRIVEKKLEVLEGIKTALEDLTSVARQLLEKR